MVILCQNKEVKCLQIMTPKAHCQSGIVNEDHTLIVCNAFTIDPYAFFQTVLKEGGSVSSPVVTNLLQIPHGIRAQADEKETILPVNLHNVFQTEAHLIQNL